MRFSSTFGRRQTWLIRGTAGWMSLAALASLGCRREEGGKVAEQTEVPAALPESPPRTVTSDPVKIFQKAFWRSPNASDEILHGERREWMGEDGLEKWQWFLVVKPSPELVKYLRDDNAFGLVRADAMPAINEAPAWFAFKSSDMEILKAPTSNLRLIFSKTGNHLFATDSGNGFRPGAPEREKEIHGSPSSSGRLPTSPPPNPGLEE